MNDVPNPWRTSARNGRKPSHMPRPMCALCGSPYGKRSTSQEVQHLPLTVTVPEYRGKLELIAESVKTEKHLKPEFRDSVNDQATLRNPDAWEQVTVVRREFWDGASWAGGYHPFCSLRCALAFAQAAFRDGCRYVLKDSA